MYQALQVVTIVLTAVTMGLALAHAAEIPGKLRLPRETYLAVQPIYYPGFAIGGGVAEFGGLVALLVLVLATPRATPEWGWTLAALLAFAMAHAVFWLVTRRVNAYWSKPSTSRVSVFAFGKQRDGARPDWKRLRMIWETSHAVRAAIALAGLVCLAIAVAT